MASVAEGSVVCAARRTCVGEAFGVVSYKQFLFRDCIRDDLSSDQMSYLATFQHVGFPGDLRMEDGLARVLSRRPHTPDLLGFVLNEFCIFLMLRRGDIDWNELRSNVSKMTPDDRDAFFVDFVKRRRQQGHGVAWGTIEHWQQFSQDWLAHYYVSGRLCRGVFFSLVW